MEVPVFRMSAAKAVAGVLLLGLPACAYPPPEASAPYLEHAQAAVRAHQGDAAVAALDQAESAWLASNAAEGNPIVHHQKPALRAIGLARAAAQGGRWDQAAHYIDAALAHPSTLGFPAT